MEFLKHECARMNAQRVENEMKLKKQRVDRVLDAIPSMEIEAQPTRVVVEEPTKVRYETRPVGQYDPNCRKDKPMTPDEAQRAWEEFQSELAAIKGESSDSAPTPEQCGERRNSSNRLHAET